MPDTHLILHVKGTENETTVLPKQDVRQAISQGQLTHSQLIWSPTENKWKQVRELPHLWPSQKLAPAPVPRAGTGALPHARTMPKVVTVPRPATGTIPRAVAKAAGATPRVVDAQGAPQAEGTVPRVKVATPRVHSEAPQAQGATAPRVRAGATPQVRAVPARQERSTGDLVVKEHHGMHPVKWLCIILAAVIVLAVGINYFLVGQQLSSRMGQTAYANTTVYAHLGAFMQPNVLVIHVFSSPKITEDNLTDYMVALAKSTPEAPFSHDAFDRVALTSGWTGKYSISGFSWKQLGDMGKDDAEQRKEFLLDQMASVSGQPLMSDTATMSDADVLARREQMWKEFVAEFVHP